ncbi:MAG: phage tail tube protein [Caulobacteraceae bacterium]|nr:phage tail tube protein [Caulobacteraceae bacterium]
MAKPTTLPFSSFQVLLGDGATPETFSAPCGFTKRSLKLSSQTSDTIVPDCDDPTIAAWTERNVSSLSGQVSGNGVTAMGSLSTWRAWFLSGQTKNIRILFNLPGAQGGGYFQGGAVLTDWSHDADIKSEGGRTQQSVTLDNDGLWAWTDNP